MALQELQIHQNDQYFRSIIRFGCHQICAGPGYEKMRATTNNRSETTSASNYPAKWMKPHKIWYGHLLLQFLSAEWNWNLEGITTLVILAHYTRRVMHTLAKCTRCTWRTALPWRERQRKKNRSEQWTENCELRWAVEREPPVESNWRNCT